MEAIWVMFLDYYFVCGLFRLLAFFSCLVEIVVLFSTGCSRVGIPLLSLRGLLKENCISFPHSGSRPSYKFLHQCSFYRILCCVARCNSGELFWVSSELVFQWRKVSIHWEVCEEAPWDLLIHLASCQGEFIPYSAVSVQIYIILGRSYRGGYSSFFGR